MNKYQPWILTACIMLTAVSMTAALSATQDEVVMTMVMSNEPLLILRGEGQLVEGQASVDLPSSFEALVDSDKPTQCFVSAVANNSAAAASLDKVQKKLNVQGNGNNRFHWLVVGTPKSRVSNHR